MKGRDKARIAAFAALVKEKGEELYRDFPWRETRDPYRILVSEYMLQQTQTSRVEEKYETFIRLFPDIKSLASSSLKDILRAWNGLGYNRRAVYLHRAAHHIVRSEKGFPRDRESLLRLPGVGPATAGAVCTFAFGKKEVFVETNIRRVFIHHFFSGKARVSDGEIKSVLAQTLPLVGDVRRFYYALYDYGSFLPKQLKHNPNTASAAYSKQTPFEGSLRKLRGEILRFLLDEKSATDGTIKERLGERKSRVARALESLRKDGIIAQEGETYVIL